MKRNIIRSIIIFVLILAMTTGLMPGLCKKAEAATFKITYDLNGGTLSPYDSTKVITKKVVAGRVTIEQSGYYPGKEIIGWSSERNGLPIFYQGMTVELYCNDIKLYAVWGNPGLKIQMMPGKNQVGGTITKWGLKNGETVTLESIKQYGSPTGFHFEFYNDKALTKKATFPFNIRENRYLYYKVVPNVAHISFYNNGRYIGQKDIYTLDSLSKFTSIPSYSGKVFLGWSTSSDGRSGIYRKDHICCFETDGMSIIYHAQLLEKDRSIRRDLIMNQLDLYKVTTALDNRTRLKYEDYKKIADNKDRNGFLSKLSAGLNAAGAFAFISHPVAGCILTCGGIFVGTLVDSTDISLISAQYVTETTQLYSQYRILDGIRNDLDCFGPEAKVSATCTYASDSSYFWTAN